MAMWLRKQNANGGGSALRERKNLQEAQSMKKMALCQLPVKAIALGPTTFPHGEFVGRSSCKSFSETVMDSRRERRSIVQG